MWESLLMIAKANRVELVFITLKDQRFYSLKILFIYRYKCMKAFWKGSFCILNKKEKNRFEIADHLYKQTLLNKFIHLGYEYKIAWTKENGKFHLSDNLVRSWGVQFTYNFLQLWVSQRPWRALWKPKTSAVLKI